MKSTNKTGKTKKAFHALRWTLVFGTHSDSVGASASGILTDHMELFTWNYLETSHSQSRTEWLEPNVLKFMWGRAG